MKLGFIWMTRVLSLAGLSAVAACASGPGGDEAVATHRAGLWDCSAETGDVTCTRALTETTSDAPGAAAYACGRDEVSERCPDPVSLDAADGLDEATEQSAEFRAQPWACLVTGGQQHECVKPKKADTRLGGKSGGIGKPHAAATASAAPVAPAGANTCGACPPGDAPAIPATCEPKDWEPYFQQLATHEYRGKGVKITFPREIFDTSKAFQEIAQRPRSNAGTQSCHDGEWAMRRQSWLDAVQHGCSNLNDAILVMCQQAANYAPECGACAATGSW